MGDDNERELKKLKLELAEEKGRRIKAELEKEKAEKETKIEKEGRDIFFMGLKEVKTFTFTTNSALINNSYEVVNTTEKNFTLVDSIKINIINSILLERLNSNICICNEYDVDTLIRDLLLDVSKVIGLKYGIEKRQISANIGNNIKVTADLMLLREEGGSLFLVLQIKLPTVNNTNLKDTKSSFYGELFEQMIHVRNLHGVREVFGILTTYHEFRVCWFEESDWLANYSLKYSDVFDKTSQVWKDRIKNASSAVSDLNKRSLFVSKIYSVKEDGKGKNCLYLKVICSVILKAYISNKLQLWRTYNEIIKDGWNEIGDNLFWIAKASLKKHLITDTIENEFRNYKIVAGNPCKFNNHIKNSNIVLLRHLGDGHDGYAWLSMAIQDKQYVMFVLKRFYLEETAKKELYYWNEIYLAKNPCFKSIVPHGGGFGIMMPYFHSCNQNNVTKKELENFMQKFFWERGIAHNDLKWSNIGLSNSDSKEINLIVYDLAFCEKSNNPKEKDQLNIDNMYSQH